MSKPMNSRKAVPIRKIGACVAAQLTGVLMLLAMTQLGAQELAAERAKVLQVIGSVKETNLNLFPVLPTEGLVFQHEVNESGALNLRVHFVIDRAGEAWEVRIKDENGLLAWSTRDDEVAGDSFWSDEIAGTKAIIEVHSRVASNVLQLVIDKIVIGTSEITPVSISGPNQLTSIDGQDDWIVEFGESVARLRFVGDGGSVFVCTAFLVTTDIMLTNQHCISTDSEMKSALVDFDFDAPGPPGETLRLVALLDTDFTLDYSVIRLSQVVARQPLELDTTHPNDDQQLLIIQHPAGEPKQISLADCKVDGPLVTGRGGTPTDFGHLCDTKGGSSGSPVLNFDSRTVVGLHHLGISPTSADLFNRATHIDLVLDDMDSSVKDEILSGQ